MEALNAYKPASVTVYMGVDGSTKVAAMTMPAVPMANLASTPAEGAVQAARADELAADFSNDPVIVEVADLKEKEPEAIIVQLASTGNDPSAAADTNVTAPVNLAKSMGTMPDGSPALQLPFDGNVTVSVRMIGFYKASDVLAMCKTVLAASNGTNSAVSLGNSCLA
jgi:hypothetical protein